MQSLSLNTSETHQNVKKIAKALSGSYYYEQNISTIKLSNSTAQGFIRAITFNHSIGLLLFDFKLSKELELLYYSEDEYHPLKIIYSFKNNFEHRVYNSKVHYQLKAKGCSISAGSGKDHHGYKFFKDTPYKLAIIEINREQYLKQLDLPESDLSPDIKKIFDSEVSEPFFYIFRNHYKLEENINEIFDLEAKAVSSRMYMEAKVMELCSLTLKLYQDQRFDKGLPREYSIYDLNQLNRARTIIETNVQTPPTIKELSKQVALNENKLKKGFKELFNMTIYNFVIEKRMEKAREMLQEHTEMSISDIAEQVGYSSKSQFTSRFKKYFGVLPKNFRREH